MKKYTILALVLVLTALTLTGCRNPNKGKAPTTVPTTYATTEPMTRPATEATQQPTATTHATENTVPTSLPGDETTHTTESNSATDNTNATGEGRARRAPANG